MYCRGTKNRAIQTNFDYLKRRGDVGGKDALVRVILLEEIGDGSKCPCVVPEKYQTGNL
jgi:hypothetical protein